MSGRALAPILEQHNDVYITGSTVVRHKVSEGRESDVFHDGYDTQLVLSAKCLYKLRQRLPPPPPTTKDENEARQQKQTGMNSGVGSPLPTRLEQLPLPPPELVWRESLGLIRAVVPLYNHPCCAWAAERNEQYNNCCGFAIEYFTHQKAEPKPVAKRTVLQRYIQEQCHCVVDIFTDLQLRTTATSCGGCGGLRVREFHVGLARPHQQQPSLVTVGQGSLYLQEDWCQAFRVARMNYWHERLEDELIEDPEVFQYQVFAMEFIEAAASAAVNEKRGKGQPLLCQLVLSTERLYLVPRHDAKLLSMDLPLHHPTMRGRWLTVTELKNISIDFSTGILVCTGMQKQRRQALYDADIATQTAVSLTIGFFALAEVEEAVLEIQRVWELTHRHEDFPLT